ncbi:GNAT family N-acetyltransferase [Sphingobacteriaceae bacterium]|nr:GNAT family N-acetyltransferase [Sphingobacteriaceae bacterium]
MKESAQIQIIRAGQEQLSLLKNISVQTFSESFANANTMEDMDLYLKDTFNDALLEKELKDHETLYYLIFFGSEAAGYLKLNLGENQKESLKEAVEIERIYILREFQNKNLGLHLLEKTYAVAQENNLKQVWLGVWEHNPGAIRFYKRNDFVEFGQHPFILGTDKQTDILMKRYL